MIQVSRTRFLVAVLSGLAVTSAFTSPGVVRFNPPAFSKVSSRGFATQPLSLAATKSGTNKLEDERKGIGTTKKTISTQPNPVLVDALQRFVGKEMTSVSLAAASLALAAMLASPIQADAAMSGGRMGGSFSRSSGGGMSTRMIAPSTPRYYGGYPGGGYYSRPIIPAPIVVPFASPYYGAPGVGVISYNRGFGFFDLLMLGGIGFFILNAIRGATNTMVGTADSWTDSSVFSGATSSALGPGASVLQLSVALNVPNRDDPNSILSVLDRLARTAKTDSRVGVQDLTSQVALELLRRKSSISAGYSRYNHFNDASKALRHYNSLAVQERSKFENELVSKYGGVDYSSERAGRSSLVREAESKTRATMAVITIVLSIAGDSTKIPQIRSSQDVEEALRRISADVKVSDCLTGAEILWTPEDRTETLSFRDVVADYPELNSL